MPKAMNAETIIILDRLRKLADNGDIAATDEIVADNVV